MWVGVGVGVAGAEEGVTGTIDGRGGPAQAAQGEGRMPGKAGHSAVQAHTLSILTLTLTHQTCEYYYRLTHSTKEYH